MSNGYSQKHFKFARNVADEYRKAGKLTTALKLFDANLTDKTAKAIIDGVESKRERNKIGAFVEFFSNIPRVQALPHVEYYKMVMDICGLDRRSQGGLQSYKQKFAVVFPEKLRDIENNFMSLKMRGYRRAGFVQFSFRYHDASENNSYKCSGMIIKKGDTNHIAGMGENCLVTARTTDARFSDVDPSFGRMYFDFGGKHRSIDSEFAIIDRKSKHFAEGIAEARAQLQ